MITGQSLEHLETKEYEDYQWPQEGLSQEALSFRRFQLGLHIMVEF